MDDKYGEERQRKWSRIFQEVVSPLLIRDSSLGINKFVSVEGTSLDVEHNIDYYMITDKQDIPIAVRGRRHSYKDLTLRQIEYLKLSNNLLRKKLGEEIEYFPVLYLYYSVDDETLSVCKTVSVYKTSNVIEAADKLEKEKRLKWNKIGNHNAFAPVSMYEIDRISRMNGDELFKFQNNGYIFVCSKHLKNKEIMVDNKRLRCDLF